MAKKGTKPWNTGTGKGWIQGYKDSGDEHDWEAIEPFHKSYAMLQAAIAKAEGKP